jgi:SAM-dependent methyltransferase
VAGALSLETRSAARELLDGPTLDPDELALNLREMAMLNRLPGGVSSSVRIVLRELETDGGVVLDAGTGSGDFARRLVRESLKRLPRSAARDVQVVAVELRPEVLAVARRTLAGTPNVTLLEADVRELPMADAVVDVAHASLLLHHLEPEEVVAALRELRRVARRSVVVNDLRRGLVPFVMTAAPVLAYSRGAYTRHDGILSARRAYTLDETDALAAEAGLRRAWRSPAFWPRVTTVYR